MMRMLTGAMCVILIGAAVASAGPKIHCENPIHKFGNRGQNSKFDVSFTIENRGNANLKLNEIVLTCGCTKYKIANRTIAPGSKETLKISASTAKKGPGKHDWKVRLHTNDPENPIYVLSLKGRIVPAFMAPEQVVLGNVRHEEGKAVTIDITRRKESKASITSMSSTSKFVTGEVIKRPSDGDNKCKVRIAVTENAETGVIDERLTLRTSDKKQRRFYIHVTGKVVPEIDVSVERVFFGVVSRKANPERDVLITQSFSTDGEDLDILDASLNGEHLLLTSQALEKGRKYRLSLKVKSDTPTGTLMDKLIVKTNKSKFPTIEIPVYGLIRE